MYIDYMEFKIKHFFWKHRVIIRDINVEALKNH